MGADRNHEERARLSLGLSRPLPADRRRAVTICEIAAVHGHIPESETAGGQSTVHRQRQPGRVCMGRSSVCTARCWGARTMVHLYTIALCLYAIPPSMTRLEPAPGLV